MFGKRDIKLLKNTSNKIEQFLHWYKSNYDFWKIILRFAECWGDGTTIPFRGLRSLRNSLETQQSGQAPIWTEIKNGSSSVKDGAGKVSDARQPRRRWVKCCSWWLQVLPEEFSFLEQWWARSRARQRQRLLCRQFCDKLPFSVLQRKGNHPSEAYERTG